MPFVLQGARLYCFLLIALVISPVRAYAQFGPDYTVYGGTGFSNTPYQITHTYSGRVLYGFVNAVRGNVAFPAGEDFELSYTLESLESHFFAGLSADPEASASYELDLAIWHDGWVMQTKTYYDGQFNFTNSTPTATGEVFSIKRTGNTIEFMKDGVAFNTIPMPVALRNVPLYFDSSWWTGAFYEGSVNGITIHSGTEEETADISANKSVAVWDPQEEGLEPVPGNDVIYTIEVNNAGPGAADEDTMIIIDSLPGELDFYNGDVDGDGAEVNPVSFTQAAGTGLSFTYGTDIAFSDSATKPTSFDECTYTPSAGYDPSIAHICVNPKGAFAVGDFTLAFRARIR